MRNLWDVTTSKGKGVVTLPKKNEISGIKRLIEEGSGARGIRKNLLAGKKRHEFQARPWIQKMV